MHAHHRLVELAVYIFPFCLRYPHLQPNVDEANRHRSTPIWRRLFTQMLQRF